MFEKLREIDEDGIFIVYPSEFDSIELMNLMAPSFVVGIKDGGYIVIFDPRSTTVSGMFETTNSPSLRRIEEMFRTLLHMDVSVEKKMSFENSTSIIDSIREDVEFYESMGVAVLETDSSEPLSEVEFSKVLDRFRIFAMVSSYTKNQRYSPEECFISLSPGVSGMSAFLSVETRFMIWLKNETKVEGEKFRYSLIRAFNVVVAKLTGKFGYERMSILPYETMIILTRDVEKFEKFLKVLDALNEKIKPYLVSKFPIWAEKMRSFEKINIIDAVKSKEDFLDMIASIPNDRGVEILKSRISSSIEDFNNRLSMIGEELGKWMEDLLR